MDSEKKEKGEDPVYRIGKDEMGKYEEVQMSNKELALFREEPEWVHVYAITPNGTILSREGENTVQEMLQKAQKLPPGKYVWDFVGAAISMDPKALASSIKTLKGQHWIAFPMEAEDGTHMCVLPDTEKFVRVIEEGQLEYPNLNSWELLQKGITKDIKKTII